MNHNKQCVRMQSINSEQETVTSCCEYSTGRYRSVQVGTIMIRTVIISLFVFWCNSPQWARVFSFTRFLDNTQQCTTVGRTPLDGWTSCRRDLYLTTHTTLTTNFHAPDGIWTHDLIKRVAADLCLRPRSHWDWQLLSVKKKVKVKWSRYRPGVAQRVGRGIALLFHDRATRREWVVSSTPQPHFTPRKDLVPILQEARWAPGPVWMGGKCRPHRDSIPDHPAHNQSLYRLSYLAHSYYQ